MNCDIILAEEGTPQLFSKEKKMRKSMFAVLGALFSSACVMGGSFQTAPLTDIGEALDSRPTVSLMLSDTNVDSAQVLSRDGAVRATLLPGSVQSVRILFRRNCYEQYYYGRSSRSAVSCASEERTYLLRGYRGGKYVGCAIARANIPDTRGYQDRNRYVAVSGFASGNCARAYDY